MVLVQVAAGIMGSSVVKYGFNFFLFFARDSEVFVVWIGELCSSSCKLNKYSCGLKLDHRNFKALKQFDFDQNLFNKFVNRHGLIVDKYGAALREMRLPIQA